MYCRNVRIKGFRTSIRLEKPMWEALESICANENKTVHQICNVVAEKPRVGGFTSALRVFILDYFRSQVPSQRSQRG